MKNKLGFAERGFLLTDFDKNKTKMNKRIPTFIPDSRAYALNVFFQIS